MYGGWLVLATAIQATLIFPRAMAGASSGHVPPGVELISLVAPDGIGVQAWLAIGVGCTREHPGACVVFAHGNGELIDHNLELLRFYQDRGVCVLMPEYRGYGRAAGTPSRDTVVGDIRQLCEWLRSRPEVDAKRIIYHGRSLGGGILAEVARTQKPCGVIVESTFTSMRAMFGRYLVPGFLCRQQMEPLDVFSGLGVPVLVMHGCHDTIVPVDHGRRLAKAIPGATYIEFACGHNDLPPDRGRYAEAIDGFLSAVRASDQPERPR